MTGQRTPLRGRKGWERRLAERGVEGGREPQGKPSSGTAPIAPDRPSAPSAPVPPIGVPARSGPGRRIPNLSGLPRWLDGTGAFETLRERLGAAAAPATNAGRHAGVTSVPHGAKSYLA